MRTDVSGASDDEKLHRRPDPLAVAMARFCPSSPFSASSQWGILSRPRSCNAALIRYVSSGR